MTRYLFYFHYWQLPDEPIEAVIDFDPTDLASKVLDEINEEISYHTGVDPEENPFMFVELYGLRPFNPKVWNMKLEEFVGHYGNSFVAIDLSKPDLGETEFFRPKKVSGGLRAKFQEIGIENDDWTARAQFETRLVSSLISWFQFYRKTKWLMIIPGGQKYEHRVWKVTTEIPESNYGATWRIVLPYSYPNEPPKLFISKKDIYIAKDVDISHIWKDEDGSIFYFISDVNAESTRWEETDYVVDFLLTGLWNFLVRSLHETFPDLLTYKNNLGNPYIIKEAPPQESIKLRPNILTEVADSDVYEDDIDYKVEIAELQEEIDYNEEVNRKSRYMKKGKAVKDDFSDDDDDSEFEEDDDGYSGPIGQLDDDEDDSYFSKENDTEEESDDSTTTKKHESTETRYKEWVFEASEEDVTKFGKLFTWLLLRVPDNALNELTLLLKAAPDHKVFYAIDWRFAIDDISEDKLIPFAKYIVNYYYTNTQRGLIYDTDREFLRDTVFKKWANIEGVTELKELLRKNVSQIKKVSYETLE